MTDCTHGPPTPCARCLIDDLDPFKYGPISRSAVLGLMHAYAAATAKRGYERGRREVFEELLHVWCKQGLDLMLAMIRSRAAEEGRDA